MQDLRERNNVQALWESQWESSEHFASFMHGKRTTLAAPELDGSDLLSLVLHMTEKTQFLFPLI